MSAWVINERRVSQVKPQYFIHLMHPFLLFRRQWRADLSSQHPGQPGVCGKHVDKVREKSSIKWSTNCYLAFMDGSSNCHTLSLMSLAPNTAKDWSGG
jgi:hypothetical protein